MHGRVRPLALGYLVVLHIALLSLLWRSDTADAWRHALDPTPAHLTAYRRDRLAFHRRGDAALPSGGWRLFGDSLTEGMPAAALPVRASNYGIGSDDTIGLAARLPAYGSLARADGVLLAIGLNDLGHDEPAAILARYVDIVDSLPRGVRVLCHGVLPVDERVRPDPGARSNARIGTLNAGLETLCTNRGHRYVPPPPALAGADGNLRSDLHDGDGVHLDADGYTVWLEHLAPELLPPDATDPDRR